MVCCAIAAFLLGVIRVVGRWLTGRPSVETPIPPQVTLSAAGSIVTVPDKARPARHRRTVVAAALRGFAVTALVYALCVEVLIRTGVAEPMGSVWLGRNTLYAVTAVGALLLARRMGGDGDARASLAGAGATWLWLGVLDQHVLALFLIADGDLLADVLFHGIGVVALVLCLPTVLPHRQPGVRHVPT